MLLMPDIDTHTHTSLFSKINGLKQEFLVDENVLQLPHKIKQKISHEILATLKRVNARDNATLQRGHYALHFSFFIVYFSTSYHNNSEQLGHMHETAVLFFFH